MSTIQETIEKSVADFLQAEASSSDSTRDKIKQAIETIVAEDVIVNDISNVTVNLVVNNVISFDGTTQTVTKEIVTNVTVTTRQIDGIVALTKERGKKIKSV